MALSPPIAMSHYLVPPFVPSLALAGLALLGANNLRAQSFDDLNRQALEAWQGNQLDQALTFANQAVTRDHDRWEGYHTLAQIQLELGQASEAKASAAQAKGLLEKHLGTLGGLDDRMRQRAKQLCDQCRTAIAAGEMLEAASLLTTAGRLAPDLADIQELVKLLPPDNQRGVVAVIDAADTGARRKKYVNNRRVVLDKKDDINRRITEAMQTPTGDAILRIIDEVDVGDDDPTRDLARQAVRDKELQKALELARAFLSNLQKDFERLQQTSDEALASGNLTLAAEGSLQLAGNKLYRGESIRIAKRVAERAPELAVPTLVLLRDQNDGVASSEAQRRLQEIYDRDAARAMPIKAQLEAAAGAGDAALILDLLKKANAIALEDFQKASKLWEAGRKDEVVPLLVQVVATLVRLGGSGPMPEESAKFGKAWTTSCGTPMRFVDNPGKPSDAARGYWIAERPPTRQEWFEIMGENLWNNPNKKGGAADLVLDGITYHKAAAFCDLLTQRAVDRLPPGYRYVLPTEAEYRQAVRLVGAMEPVFLCVGNDNQGMVCDTQRARREIIRGQAFPYPGSYFRIVLAHRP